MSRISPAETVNDPSSTATARVVQLFGRYRGTVRQPGLRWVNPFAERRPVSTRIRNHETPIAKVNDADGNPIKIAAVVVWQVHDTAQALYSVDAFVKFVATQSETAVRHIASSYPYTSGDSASGGGATGDGADGDRTDGGRAELSLRDNADEITSRLSAEISARVQAAGVTIIESRLTRLSYAAEIAQAMLRQQQASAVVELDEERKAAMVSNLLVVLCSEQATQQVVNTGSLYQ
jgi:regulator of protease activity HflC (stomatin/prohibitin superfamily)